MRRNWNEWARRWYGKSQNLPLNADVQPVVIVDDVRVLAMPPLIPKFGWFHGGGAVVGEFTVAALRPKAKPIVVESVYVTNAVNAHLVVGGVGATAFLTVRDFATGDTGAPLQWDGRTYPSMDTTKYEGSLTDLELDGIVEDNFLATQEFNGSTGARVISTVVNYGLIGPFPQIRVLPGQAAYLFTSGTNQGLSHSWVWSEYPAATMDQIESSGRVAG